MMRLLLSLLAACSVLGSAGAIVVPTAQGRVRGSVLENVTRFLGIPFAAPPIGELRWAAPAPAAPWTGVRDALFNAPDCIAGPGNYIDVANKSEDCLYLNVYAPGPEIPADPRPVMVFFYGGSWEYGGSSFPVYEGGPLVRAGGVVLVTVNYRLGPFGFLGGEALRAADPQGSVGNYGLQDQQAALRWVQANIASFGGNASRVMIFGESAGGGSVVNHMVQAGSAGLFHLAAMESGPPADWSAVPMDRAQAEFDRLAAAVNCTQAATQLACLRSQPAATILANEHEDGSLLLQWGPVIDGVALLDQPQRLWQQNKTNKVDGILLGSNTDEGTLFPSQAPALPNASAYEAFVQARYGASLAPQLLALYPADQYADLRFATSMILGDSLMACPARRAARWVTARGIPAYLYHFEHQIELVRLLRPLDGVPHAGEVPEVFGFLPMLWSEEDRRLSEAMMLYWTGFAARAAPSASGSASWPALTLEANDLLRLNATIAADTQYKAAACALWDRVYEAGCQVLVCPCACDL